MKKWFYKIENNQYFLLFIMLFAYVQSIYIRISNNEEINAYTFTPDAALFSTFKAGILFIIIILFSNKWQKAAIFSTKETVKIFSLSLLMFLLMVQLTGFFISFMFDTIDRNFNQDTLIFNVFPDFLNGFTYGSFFLAYNYYKKNKNYQLQLANYNLALSDNKIQQLKTQLNPHFLFNNLNVLDQLIDEDKQKASDFLNEFAEIYRYVLQTSNVKIISLNEELAFAVQYFNLIQHKYANAYQINFDGKNDDGYIVPLTLQLLIENAVQHNLGTTENPVLIAITISDTIHVSNNINLKRTTKQTFGRALNNLNEQYQLLTKKGIEIQHTNDAFSVTIPIINTVEL
jgi:sensor histidine kinase YesM